MAYLPPLNGGRLNASITGNTAGVPALISTGNMVLAGGNNVTLSQNGSTITINASAGGGAGSNTFGAGTAGNVSGNTGYISGSNLQMAFYGGNNITLNQSITSNSATITVSGPSFSNANNVSLGISNNGVVTGSASFNQTIQSASNIQGIGAGASTAYTGNITFSSANNISFGLSNNIMTASAAVPTASVAFSAGGSSASLASLTFANSNGVNFGLNAGVITASYAGGGGAAISAAGASASNGTVVFSNANNVNFGMNGSTLTASAAIPAGSINFSAGGSSANLASIIFASTANGVAFGLNGGTITASSPPDGIQGVSAGTLSQSTGNITFANSNNINFGLNGGVITASYTGGAGGGITLSAPGSSFTNGTVNFSATAGAISISGSSNSINFAAPAVSSLTVANLTLTTVGSTIGISAPPIFDAGVTNLGNYAGTPAPNTNGLYFVGGNNITLSQATNAAGAIITINANGANPVQRVQYPDNGPIGPISTPVNGSLSIVRAYIPTNFIMSAGVMGGSLNITSNTSASNVSMTMNMYMGLYTLSGSTLGLLTGASFNNSISYGMSATSGWSSITGMRRMSVSFTASNTPLTYPAGEYWIGMIYSSTANIAAASASANWTMYGNAAFAAPALLTSSASSSQYTSFQPQFTPLGSNTTNAREALMFQGMYSVTTSTLPATIQGSQILNSRANQVMQAANHFALINATY